VAEVATLYDRGNTLEETARNISSRQSLHAKIGELTLENHFLEGERSSPRARLLQATEYKEQGGGVTVSFQDTKTDQGFEVYVTPYADKQITPQRFKLDEPSGVIQSPTDVVIDGARATMFFGNNTIMGDTREVCSSTAAFSMK